MPRLKLSSSTVLELLEGSPDPLYVLDAKRVIVFCNEACAEWVGVRAEELVGRRVDYVAGDSAAGPPGVAAGLCPPPQAFAGEEVVGSVSCLSAKSRMLYRRARFMPLGRGAEACEGVVAFVENADQPAIELSRGTPAELSADKLHQEIRRFRATQAQRHGLEQLLGESPAMRQVRAQVAAAALSGGDALIVGPSGAGRAQVARSIFYQAGARRLGRLAPVEGALPGTDVLRHTLQALSAMSENPTPGTLLLHNADQLPPASQLLLCEHLNSVKRRPVVLATSRARLIELVASAGYLEDLARRLSTLEIYLPPLKARLGDLPLLAHAFVEAANEAGGKQIGGVAPEALDLLALHDWPGNLDELAAAIHAAHASAATHQITPQDLPVRIHHAATAAQFPRRGEETIRLEEFLARVESELITRAFAQAKGNKSKAAKLLGMNRPRLYRRLVSLGLIAESETRPEPTEEVQFEED